MKKIIPWVYWVVFMSKNYKKQKNISLEEKRDFEKRPQFRQKIGGVEKKVQCRGVKIDRKRKEREKKRKKIKTKNK